MKIQFDCNQALFQSKIRKSEIKRDVLFLTFLLCSFFAKAQTAPCLPSANGTSAGNNAPGCLLCDIQYQGTSDGFSATFPGSAGFPCGTIENNQFISFIADGNILNGTIQTTNCQAVSGMDGVQLILFDLNFNPVSNCFSSQSGLPGNIIASGLTPGEIYSIMIDGFAGDICDFTLEITSGTLGIIPANVTIDSDVNRDTFCRNETVTYSIQPEPGVLFYDWEVSGNGTILGSGMGTSIGVKWLGLGSGYVRVTPNSCIAGNTSEVNVEVIDQYYKGPFDEYHCQENFPFFIGNTEITEEGNYLVTYPSAGGCDSIIEYEIFEYPIESQLFNFTICEGEILTFLGQQYSDDGFYDIYVPNVAYNGCDSLYQLDLVVVSDVATILPPPILDCISGSTAVLKSDNSGTNNSLIWSTDSSGMILSNPTADSIIIGASGYYFLTSSTTLSSGSCIKTDTVFVEEKQPPSMPQFDTLSNFHCNFDTALFVVNSLANADSLYWIFENSDTFKTVVSDTFRYALQAGGLYNLKLAGENECGFGASADTILTVKPIDAPGIDLLANSACIGDTIYLKTPQLDTSITLQWILDGGNLITTPARDSFGIAWNTSGQKILRLSTIQDNCESPIVTDTLMIDEPFSNLNFNCQSTPSEITFLWNNLPGADNYIVRVLTGQAGNQVDTTFTVSGLSPGEQVEIEVEVSGTNLCGSAVFTNTCIAQNCPGVAVDIDAVPDICLDGSSTPFQLTTQINGGSGSGVFEWSGSGILAGGIFDPILAGIGTHVINLKYSEGNCDYLSSETIKVNQTPTSDFTVTPIVCESELIEVSYTGNASSGATFDWNFDVGAIQNGTGAGPFQVQIDQRGIYNFSLQVTENGCVSSLSAKAVQVDANLSSPVISCQSSLGEIIFSWNDVPGATNYNVNVQTGQSGTLNGNSFTIGGLTQGEMVTISVIAEGNSVCGNSSADITCESNFCPPVSIEIDSIPSGICEGEMSNFQLLGSGNGGVVFDSLNWSGTGISGNGNINYDTLAAGIYPFMVQGFKDACVYSDSFNFSVAETPELSARILAPIWNPGVIGGIDLTVQNGNAPYNFLWNNGDSSEDLTRVDRNQYCVTVTDQNGCSASDCYIIGEGIYRINPLHVVCRGVSKRISARPSRGASFSWLPSTGLSCDDCPNPNVTADKSTIYSVTATMPDGRFESTNIVVIVVNPPFCSSLASINHPNDIFSNEIDFDTNNPEEIDLNDLENQVQKLLLPENAFSAKAVNVSPNPTTGKVTVTGIDFLEKIEVFDFSGRKIFEAKGAEFDLSKEAKGVYFLKIKTGNEIFVKKIILI